MSKHIFSLAVVSFLLSGCSGESTAEQVSDTHSEPFLRAYMKMLTDPPATCSIIAPCDFPDRNR